MSPGTIIQDFGLQQTDPEALDYTNLSKWISRYSVPRRPCTSCAAKQLECWFTFEGQSECSACCALFKACSFTSHDQTNPQSCNLMDNLHVVQKDMVHSNGDLTRSRATRSWDRSALENQNLQSDERQGRRSTGTRFSREALKVLKSWVEQHSDYPYPSEDEKDTLAALTGLSNSQVSNWFANTRRRNKRRSIRAASPSTRSPTTGSMSPAITIPPSKRGVIQDGKTWDVMNPFERWKASPPEHEPAGVDAIAQAVATSRLSSHDSSLARGMSGRKPSSSAGSGPRSNLIAPSVTSCETGQTDSRKSTGSFSNHSLTSSRSHGSRNSLHSYGSGHKKERRRRNRALMNTTTTQRAAENRPFQCTFCTDTFRTKYDWTRHEKSLHLSLEKWICAPLGAVMTDPVTGSRICVYCEEKDPTVGHLESHGHRQCEEKGMDARTFYRKDHLRQHLRLVHGVPMLKSMDTWKSEATYIKCRCGFCEQEFTSWTERCDHIAKHFRDGVKMKDWRGCRGFDSEVSVFVTNAMPPFLIGEESKSPNPFRASAPNIESYDQPSIDVQQHAQDFLAIWNQTIPFGTDNIPTDHFPFDPSEGTAFIANGPTMDILNTGYKPNVRISTCWEILTVRLGRYVKQQLELGVIPSDEMLQNQARWILYESDDTWNQTSADNKEWLELFKKAHGLPSTAVDTWIDFPEDLGGVGPVGADIMGDLSFDGLTFDDMPYSQPFSNGGPSNITTDGYQGITSIGVPEVPPAFWNIGSSGEDLALEPFQ